MPNIDVTVEEQIMALRQLNAQLQGQLTEAQAVNIILNNRLLKLTAQLDGLKASAVPVSSNGVEKETADAPKSR